MNNRLPMLTLVHQKQCRFRNGLIWIRNRMKKLFEYVFSSFASSARARIFWLVTWSGYFNNGPTWTWFLIRRLLHFQLFIMFSMLNFNTCTDKMVKWKVRPFVTIFESITIKRKMACPYMIMMTNWNRLKSFITLTLKVQTFRAKNRKMWK